MNPIHHHFNRLVALTCLLVAGFDAVAEKPTLDRFYPPCGKVGTTAATICVGKVTSWPLKTWVNRTGIELKAKEKKGEFDIVIASDAQPGVYWIRIYNAEGASSLRPFVVDVCTQSLEVEPNDNPEKPQPIEALPASITGKLQKANDVDTFQIELKKGETFIASITAEKLLASPMDASLQVLNEQGFVLEHNDDYHDLDPQIVFVAPESGKYMVRTFAFPKTPNSSIRYAGADSYVYQMTLTKSAFVDHTMPLSPESGKPVQLFGWNLPADASSTPTSDQLYGIVSDSSLTNSLLLPIESRKVIVEQSAAGDTTQTIPLPVAVSGQLMEKNEVDKFTFEGKKGQSLQIRVAARAFGQPTDPHLRIRDSSGKILKENDDVRGSSDSVLTWAPPADGTYQFEIRDLYRRGGLRLAYHMTVDLATPRYSLTTAADTVAAAVGKDIEIPITVNRENGFAKEITFTIKGLPKGTSVPEVKSLPKGDSAKKVTLKIPATDTAVSSSISITGTSEGTTEPVVATISGLTHKTIQIWASRPPKPTKSK